MRLIRTVCAVWIGCGGAGFANLAQSVLDNGTIRVGINTNAYGGAITYLSLSGEDRNLINNYDRGRQVQQSYYAGEPIDRQAEGQHPAWSPWVWNPIQVGDAYDNSSLVLEHSNDGDEIYVKTRPLLWDMNNEFAECEFETWIQLDEDRVRVRNRLTTFRTDDLWPERPRHQELPAVYTIAELPHLYTYEGDEPFTGAGLTQIVIDGDQIGEHPSGPPWVYWGQTKPTEKWAAFVDDDLWGVGVYYEDTELFVGGFHRSHVPGTGTRAPSTGYISPLRTMILRKDTVFEYEYTLMVGTLEEIRSQVYKMEGMLPEESWAGWVTVYRDDFSGPAGHASTSVPEVSQPGFSAVAHHANLSGDGKLYASAYNSGAGCRVRLAGIPLTDRANVSHVKFSAVLRAPTNELPDGVDPSWIGIGFHGADGGAGFLQSGSDTGPWIQINANSSLRVRGGHGTGGSEEVIAIASSGFDRGEVITMELVYDIDQQKADLWIDDALIAEGIDMVHRLEGTEEEADPVIHWAQIHLRNQPGIEEGGAYVDSFEVSVFALPELVIDSFSAGPDGMNLSWISLRDDLEYTVEQCSDLRVGDWQPAEPAGQWPTSDQSWFLPELSALAAFYRVVGTPVFE